VICDVCGIVFSFCVRVYLCACARLLAVIVCVFFMSVKVCVIVCV